MVCATQPENICSIVIKGFSNNFCSHTHRAKKRGRLTQNLTRQFSKIFLAQTAGTLPGWCALIRPTLLQLLKIIATIGSKCLALSPFHTGGNLYWLYHWSLSLCPLFFLTLKSPTMPWENRAPHLFTLEDY